MPFPNSTKTVDTYVIPIPILYDLQYASYAFDSGISVCLTFVLPAICLPVHYWLYPGEAFTIMSDLTLVTPVEFYSRFQAYIVSF